MSRAYIRLDPGFDEHKYDYPDGAYAALVAVLCHAEHRTERGRFGNAAFLKRLLGKRGRWVGYLIEHGDLIEQPDGRLYVDGWDEWQEGDTTVKERMQRLRTRQRRNRSRNVVTTPVTADRLDSGALRDGAVSGERGAAELEGLSRNGRFLPIGPKAGKAS